MPIILGIAGAVAWFTHIFYCIDQHLYFFGAVGAVVFPVGVVHGVIIWFK